MVLDSFDLSILSSNEAKIDKKGVELIRNQLFDVLKREGLEKIEIDIGDDFDPNISEAVERVESDYESGKVVEEVEKGYKFKNKVIRPSKVKISKD
jgi:molecular chaperone GrpE